MEKSNRETLEGFQARYVELANEYMEIDNKWMGEFEGTTEYHEYMSLKEQAESSPSYQVILEDKYSEWLDLEKKKEELYKKIAAYDQAIRDTVVKVYEELLQSIASLEAKLKTNREYIEKLEQEIKEQQEKIDSIKASEAYKNGDEQTLLEVESLEKHLATTIADKEEKESRLNTFTEKIESLKKEKEALEEEFPETLRTKLAEQEDIEASAEEKNGVENEEVDKEEEPKKTTRTRGNNGAGAVANPTTSGQAAPEEQPKDEKVEFNELFARAKSGKASKEDLDRLVTIMQEPENYEKYGITTGVIFNKSKTILTAIGRSVDARGIRSWKDLKNIMENPEVATKKEEELRAIVAKDRASLTEEEQAAWDRADADLKRYSALRTSLATYKEVSRERVQRRWAWAFDFKENNPAALPEETQSEVPEQTEPSTQPTIIKLDGMVKDEPDGEMPPRRGVTEEPEQTI